MQSKQMVPLIGALLLAVGACAEGPTAPLAPADAPNLSRNAQPFTFTTIAVPDARFTVPQGINAAGDVVGAYGDAQGVHGFLYRDGEFTRIDYPGAILTEARGIGPDGAIVGTYRLPEEAGQGYALHGFLRTSAGEFLAMDYPGLPYTMPQRILPDGTVLGCHHGQHFAGMEGVVLGTSGPSEADDIHMSMHNGATPDLGRIAGLYTNMSNGRLEGYVIDDGVFQPFVVPGSTLTAAWDVSPQGDIVGVYRNAAGFHGFVRTGDAYMSIDFPGALHTRAVGVNARGDVVGTYVTPAGRTYGFVATRQPGLGGTRTTSSGGA